MNRVEITGRLTRAPETRYVGATDFPIVSLNLGVEDGEGRWNRETKKVELGSGFYKVEVAGEYGLAITASLDKGDEVHVIGSLSQFTVGGRDGKEAQTKTSIRAKVVTPLTGTGLPVDRPVEAPPKPLFDDNQDTEYDIGEEPF